MVSNYKRLQQNDNDPSLGVIVLHSYTFIVFTLRSSSLNRRFLARHCPELDLTPICMFERDNMVISIHVIGFTQGNIKRTAYNSHINDLNRYHKFRHIYIYSFLSIWLCRFMSNKHKYPKFSVSMLVNRARSFLETFNSLLIIFEVNIAMTGPDAAI